MAEPNYRETFGHFKQGDGSVSLTFGMLFQERDAKLRYCDTFGFSPRRMIYVFAGTEATRLILSFFFLKEVTLRF